MEKDVQQPAEIETGTTPNGVVKVTSDEPKQTPDKGYEIPVPTKEQVMDFFKKVARAPKRS
jgi:hypothetical protein